MPIPRPTVEIGFDIIPANADLFTLDSSLKGRLDNVTYRLGGQIFYDVTDKVKSIATRRGKNRQLDEFDGGLANVVFDNNDRTFDPEYVNSPYYGQIIPKRAIRISSFTGNNTITTTSNLVPNPSFEGQSLVTITNLVTNPSFETNTTGWTRSGGTSFNRITSDFLFGSACGQLIATGSGNLVYIDISVTAAQTYVFSAYVKGEAGKTVSVDIEEVGVGTTNGTAFTLNGTWQRMSVTRTFTTGTTARCRVQNRGAVANTILIDGAMLTVGATTQTYFDGNTTDVNDTAFAWTGAANNSSSTEQSNAAVSVRRNLAANPNIELGTQTLGGSRVNFALETTTKYFGNQALRATTNSAAGIQYIDAQLYPVTTGLPYTASVYLFMPLTNSSDRSVRIELHPHTGTGYLARIDGNLNISVPRGEWVRITASGTAPATAVSVLMRLVPTTTLALNDVMIVDGYLLEQSNTLGDYFDGNFGASGDYDYRWSGVIGNSTSEQLVRQVVGSSTSTNAAAGMSRAWDSTGVRSLLVAPNASNNDSHIRFSFAGLTAGNTYTALVKCRLSAPLTGTLNARSRQISAWDSSFTTNAGSATAPNTTGETELRLTFTALSSTTIIALHNGASVNNGSVWFDDFALIEGTYDAEYFDGNTTDSNFKTYSWLGATDASVSQRVFNAELAGRVFTGVIDDWNLNYDPGGFSEASAASSDAFTLFNTQTLPAGTATAQKSGERVNAVLNLSDVNWSTQDRDIETGLTSLGADVYEQDTNVLEYLRTVARSEPGNLFMSKAGSVVFTDRNAAPSSAEVVLSDDGTGIPYHGMKVVYGSELLYNEIVIGSLAAGTVVARDIASIADYGVLNLTQTGLLMSDPTYVQSLALYYASKYSQPEYRFESVEIVLNELTSAQQQSILELEISDFVTIKFTPNGIAPAIEKIAEIIRIDEDITPEFHTVTLGFATVDNGFWRLSDSIFGRLSTGNVLGF
jgi:hypothetical protein